MESSGVVTAIFVERSRCQEEEEISVNERHLIDTSNRFYSYVFFLGNNPNRFLAFRRVVLCVGQR